MAGRYYQSIKIEWSQLVKHLTGLNNMEKQKCFNEIRRAIEHAMECGYKVVVASDPEGNSWNGLNPQYMIYGNEKPGYIALGVWDGVDEGDVFKNICLGRECDVEIPDGESVCEKCKLDPKMAWALINNHGEGCKCPRCIK